MLQPAHLANHFLDTVFFSDPTIRDGRLCFKNTRIPVEHVLEHIHLGWNGEEIKALFPDIKPSHIDKLLITIADTFHGTAQATEKERKDFC